MIVLRPEVKLHDLPRLEVDGLRQVMRALMALRENPEHPDGFRVDELHASHVALDLTGCCALKTTGVSYDSALRVVYRLVGGDVDVLAVGRRQGSLVYQQAQSRLRPQAKPRRLRTHTSKDFEPRGYGLR